MDRDGQGLEARSGPACRQSGQRRSPLYRRQGRGFSPERGAVPAAPLRGHRIGPEVSGKYAAPRVRAVGQDGPFGNGHRRAHRRIQL